MNVDRNDEGERVVAEPVDLLLDRRQRFLQVDLPVVRLTRQDFGRILSHRGTRRREHRRRGNGRSSHSHVLPHTHAIPDGVPQDPAHYGAVPA